MKPPTLLAIIAVASILTALTVRMCWKWSVEIMRSELED